jgi:hypothetical protein
MTAVYWGYFPGNSKKLFELLLLEPAPALPEIIGARDVSNPRHFVRCPAFREYYKNTYVLKSPVDMDIMYTPDNKFLRITPQDQEFYDASIVYRGDAVGEGDDFLMSFSINYIFIADKDCELELTQASMHKSDFINKTTLIGGSFNINKWYRPVEIAFEIKDLSSPIRIKRGDPLAYVRFKPKDDGKVSLQFKEFSEETKQAINACLFVKDVNNQVPLNTLYEIAKRIRNKLWFNKKKCPFNWRNK